MRSGLHWLPSAYCFDAGGSRLHLNFRRYVVEVESGNVVSFIETIREAAELAAKPAKPLDNADLSHFWRKRMVRTVVEQALQRISDQRVGFGG